MIRQVATIVVLAASLGAAHPVVAQDQGARIGNSYIPSTHSKGCSGLMCDGDDPRRAVSAPPPPPCQGLLCTVSPYGMGRPVTAAEAQRIQEEQARAAAATPAPVPDEPKRGKRRSKSKARAKAKAAKAAVASRTPDPASATPAAK